MYKKSIENSARLQRGGGHSGPGGRRINFSKCIKNQAKWGIFTLTIAFHENEIDLNKSKKKKIAAKKHDFWSIFVQKICILLRYTYITQKIESVSFGAKNAVFGLIKVFWDNLKKMLLQ